jgi:hypothetical protein
MRMPGKYFWALLAAAAAVVYSMGWTPLPSFGSAAAHTNSSEPPHGVDEWEEEDVLRFFTSCNITVPQMQAMRSLGLNGHSLMLLDNDTLHHIGMAANDLQFVLSEIESLRQRVHAAPLDFWEWRAVNLRFNDMWLMPLALNHRTVLAWVRLCAWGDGPISGNSIHSQGFFSFWITWLLNPFFALYRAVPDDPSFPAQLGRVQFLVLAFKDLYAFTRWLLIFRSAHHRSQWWQIVAANLNEALPADSRCVVGSSITFETMTRLALKCMVFMCLLQVFNSSFCFVLASITYYIVWYVSLRFVLHGVFYTFAFIIAPAFFTYSLYHASPLIREALLLFEVTVLTVYIATLSRAYAFIESFVPVLGNTNKKLKVDRSNLLQTSVRALRGLGPEDFAPQRTFRIEFVGECAIDVGGVFREWHSANYKALSEFALLQVTNSFGEPTGLHRLNPAISASFSDDSAIADNLWLFGCIIGLSVSETLPTGVSITPALAKRLLGREDTLTLQDLAFELPTFEYLLGIESRGLRSASELQTLLRQFDVRFRTPSASAAAEPDADGDLFSPLSRTHSPSEGVTSESFGEYVNLMIQKHLVGSTARAVSFVRRGFELVINADARRALTPQSLAAALRGDTDLSHLKRVIDFSPRGAAADAAPHSC